MLILRLVVIPLLAVPAWVNAKQYGTQVQPVSPYQSVNTYRPVTTYKPERPIANPQWGSKSATGSSAVNTPPKSSLGALNGGPYSSSSIGNPSGAGSKYKADGVKNPNSQYGSPYSHKSATNPYATEPPTIVDSKGNYRGELSTNPYRKDSVANPFGEYGSPYSPKSINNPYGAGNPYSKEPLYVVPGSTDPKKN